MEGDGLLDSNIGEGFTITESSRSYLREAAKWARFLAIIGFVFIGLMVLLGVFFGSVMGGLMSTMPDDAGFGAMDGGAFGLIYVALALIYFFPTFYLYRFGTRIKQALQTEDSQTLALGLEQLKSCFKFMGIFMIIILSLYALIFVFALVFGAFAAF